MSAFIVGPAHIDFILHAGLMHARNYGCLSWMAPGIKGAADRQRGEAWGPTWVETATRARRELTYETADAVGQMLVAENYRSVHHRYAETPTIEAAEPYTYQMPADFPPGVVGHVADPVWALKAVDCYEYQSCEHEGWEASEAQAFCQVLRGRLVAALPGYDAAPWEITFPRGPGARAAIREAMARARERGGTRA